MLVSTIVVAALGIALERAIEGHLGFAGLIGLLILRTGLGRRNFTCTCVGTSVLATLVLTSL
ncbi:hypothetical protein [Streptomyces sp. RFCAC02]|uniref:hypothetical protein n=1 Tax=Streptomyces sp. RFCAC02 TaxID=2499143 RepID=UPI001021C1BD|nr:hypothetical protein [Streptomyces sp. RFCAC02]